MKRINVSKELYMSNLKIPSRTDRKLICKYCGKTPHWFGKFCCLEAEFNFLK